jgi:hypothetical protein
LDPVARVELFGEIATHFRGKAQFPAEATDGITDEQYVRNVVDVLYRTRTGERLAKPSHLSDASDKSDSLSVAARQTPAPR